MRQFAAILVAICLAACSSSPAPTSWEFQFSDGMPAAPPTINGLPSFNLPIGTTAVGSPSVHYLVRGGRGIAGTIKTNWRLSLSDSATVQYLISPDNTCGGSPKVSLYFQRKGDDWRAGPETQFFRWWSDAGELRDGEGSLSVPLEPGRWSSVLGIRGDQAVAQFTAAVADPVYVGLTFGGGCFSGHGINIDRGSGVFTLTNFAAQ